jgi:hypothetical protein
MNMHVMDIDFASGNPIVYGDFGKVLTVGVFSYMLLYTCVKIPFLNT